MRSGCLSYAFRYTLFSRCLRNLDRTMVDKRETYSPLRRDALRIFDAALQAVSGTRRVVEALNAAPPNGDFYAVAIGKAAVSMMTGAREIAGANLVKGLVIAKHGHAGMDLTDGERVTVIESDHPLPGAASLFAGDRLLRFMADAPGDAEFLFLISGGASSLVEVLHPAWDLTEYRKASDWLLGSGLDIHQINTVRKRFSLIKGGGLRRYLEGRRARCLLISDVPGDDPASIGSGLLVNATPAPIEIEIEKTLPDWLRERLKHTTPLDLEAHEGMVIPHTIVADNRHAREAACSMAGQLGYSVTHHERLLTGDALDTGAACAREVVQGARCVSVWGGETTIALPPRPGRGGRNQGVALVAAREIVGTEDCVVLAAGSDGTDGPTEDAGALVDGETLLRGEEAGLDAEDCLARADAGRFLAASGDLIQTGPTGTNVMDLLIGIRTD